MSAAARAALLALQEELLHVEQRYIFDYRNAPVCSCR